VNLEGQNRKYSALLQVMLEAPKIAFEELKPSALPQSPGVYRIFETCAKFRETVYIGESKNLRNRIYRSHLMGTTRVSTLKKKLVASGKYPDAAAVKAYLRHDCSIQCVIIPRKRERMRFEHFAVAMLGPCFND
jgi:hypothetical protein